MQPERPKVAVIGCGGTISSFATSPLDTIDYPDEGRKLAVDEVLAEIPEAGDVARIVPVPFRAVSSTAITLADWLELRRTIHDLLEGAGDLAGVVVLHGTGSLEETAFFLHLTLLTERPVVLVGAQRPLNTIGSDGPMNLVAALRVAGDPNAAGRGVLVAMNDEIHSARDVTKTSNYRLQTFRSPDYGMLGQVDGDGVVFTRRLERPHTARSPFASLPATFDFPRVDILYSYLGADQVLVEACLKAGAKGLVSAGFPPGLLTPAMRGRFERLGADVPVVLCSRAGSGRVAERKAAMRHGFVAGQDFSPQKARILLALALAKGYDLAAVREVFRTI